MFLPESEAPTITVKLMDTDMKTVCEALSKEAFKPFSDEFKKVGWNISNLTFVTANYLARPKGYEGDYEISLREFSFNFDLIPEKDAVAIEVVTGEWINVKSDLSVNTGFAISTIVGLSVIAGIALLIWLGIRESRIMIGDVIKSPYAHDFFETLKSGIFSVVIIGVITLLILLAITGGDLKSLFTGGGKNG